MPSIIFYSLHTLCLVALAAGVTVSATASAEEPVSPVIVTLPVTLPVTVSLPVIVPLPVNATPPTTVVEDGAGQADFFAPPFSSGREVLPDVLSQLRGGSVVVSSNQTLGGTVAENVANNVVTGGNFISEGSFANASGIPIVIQNSGANVLIQNSTVLNLELK